jgi:hypothetical protein
MINQYDIHYIKQKDIDLSKWDDCLEKSQNGLIYGYTYYLNHMAKSWDGLVLNDYQALMPLTWNKKINISYLYQPAFTASLGIFGNDLNENLVGEFIRGIPKKFKLVEIALNQGNIFSHPISSAVLRSNYTLSLKKTYTEIAAGYSENIRRNIRKAEQLNCFCRKNIPVSEVISLSRPVLKKTTRIKETDYSSFEKLHALLFAKKQAITYGVYSASGDLMASCVFFFSKKRAYYILVGNHPEGKTMGASHYLIDCFIKQYAGQDLVLDFEGSDIRNLAFFYSSFGAIQEFYPFLKMNSLPFWLKWLKNQRDHFMFKTGPV